MTPETAFQIVAAACASVNANLQQHQQIQEALQVFHDMVPVPANGDAKVTKG